MRVLQALKFSHPKVGGIERVAHTVATAAVRRGDDVRVVSSVERGCGERAVYDGVRTLKAPSLGVVLSVPVAPTYSVHLRRAKRPADIVHFHLPDPLSVASELLTGTTDGALVATYHNDIARSAHRRTLAAYRPVLNRFLDRLDEIVVTSPRLRDCSPFLESYRDKCTVIPLGIDLDDFGTYQGQEFELPGNPDRPTVLFVGRLIYYKGLKYAIEAMRDVDADLLVAGTGELRNDLNEIARENEVESRVHFLGYVSEEKKHYCYDSADVFVLPSIATSEGFGIVQLEAMSYGTPVVNTNIETGVPWVSQDRETGLTVPPEDPDRLAQALDEVLSDDELRERLGRAARRRVEERFTKERMIREYLRRYDAHVE